MSLATVVSTVSAYTGTITANTVRTAMTEAGINNANGFNSLIKNVAALHKAAEEAKPASGGKTRRRRHPRSSRRRRL